MPRRSRRAATTTGAERFWLGLAVTCLAIGLLLLAPVARAQELRPRAVPNATPVATRALARGEILTAADVQGTNATALVGWTTRRVIAAGEPLRAPAVAPPDVVTAGQPVAVVWREPGIEVRLAGTAANAAPIGGRVTVRVDVRRRLEGVVVAPGVVRLQP